MQFYDRPAKTLAGQFSQGRVERGGLEREVARFDAIGLAGRYRLPRLHAQGFLARAHPQRKVRQPWRALEFDLREIAESRHRRVEQGTQDLWCSRAKARAADNREENRDKQA